MKKRIISMLVLVMMITVMLPQAVSAASRVKMTGYNEVIKSGSTVYCAGDTGIYRVKLSNGKVKAKKRLVKNDWPYGAVGEMKKKGNYIYYSSYTSGTVVYICRVNVKTGKTKTLAEQNDPYKPGYVIKNSKIYYYNSINRSSARSMKLNGTSKKKAPGVIIDVSTKASNAKGYSVKTTSGYDDEDIGFAKDYLKTPRGKYYLGKCKEY